MASTSIENKDLPNTDKAEPRIPKSDAFRNSNTTFQKISGPFWKVADKHAVSTPRTTPGAKTPTDHPSYPAMSTNSLPGRRRPNSYHLKPLDLNL